MAKPELRPLGWEDEEPFPDTIAALIAWIKPEGYEVAVLTTTTDEYLPHRRKSCRERLDAINLRIATWLVWKGIAERPEWFGAACGNPAERLLAWHVWLSTLAATNAKPAAEAPRDGKRPPNEKPLVRDAVSEPIPRGNGPTALTVTVDSDPSKPSIILANVRHPLENLEVAEFLRDLVAAPTEYLSAAAYGVRTRQLDKLPAEVLARIERKPNAGCRWLDKAN